MLRITCLWYVHFHSNRAIRTLAFEDSNSTFGLSQHWVECDWSSCWKCTLAVEPDDLLQMLKTLDFSVFTIVAIGDCIPVLREPHFAAFSSSLLIPSRYPSNGWGWLSMAEHLHRSCWRRRCGLRRWLLDSECSTVWEAREKNQTIIDFVWPEVSLEVPWLHEFMDHLVSHSSERPVFFPFHT